jgi:hypothetical protein
MTKIQKLGWAYVLMFIIVVAVGYIPFFVNDDGMLFGLFSIELKDDLLHLGSALWAAIAAWHSPRQTIYYFKLFGVIYFGDAIVGLLTTRGYLDLGIFLNAAYELTLWERIGANLPHILIGGIAIYIGFFYSKKLAKKNELETNSN